MMTTKRWEHLLWVWSGKPTNPTHSWAALNMLECMGLIAKTGEGWSITLEGAAKVETRRRFLKGKVRAKLPSLNSVYFDKTTQHWVANYSTEQGSALALVRTQGPRLITIHPIEVTK